MSNASSTSIPAIELEELVLIAEELKILEYVELICLTVSISSYIIKSALT